MKNLDKYFKDNLDERQFEMKDAYWEQAEKMLAAEERRRRGVWFWWGGAGLVAAVLVALFFVFPAENTQVEIAENSAPKIVTENESNMSENKMEKTINKEIKKGEKNTELGGNKKGDKINSIKKEIENYNKKRVEINGGNSASKNKSEQINATVFETNEKNILSEKNIEIETDIILRNNEIEKIIDNKNDLENTGAEITEEKIKAPEELIRESAPGALATLSFFVKKEDEKPNLKTADIKLCPESKWAVAFAAEQLFQPTPRSDEKPAIAFRTGILLRRNVGEKGGFYVASGLQYQRRTGTFEQSKLAETRNYRFGLELDTNLLRPSALHTLSLPVLLGWERGRHLVEAGLSLGYLMGVRGERGSIERIPESNPPRRDFVSAENGWIVEDGFKKWTSTAQLNYRFRMSTQWSFGFSANYTFGGVLDKINNQVPGVGVELKEDDKLYFGVQAVYLLQK